jgi:FMN phosphatase YigB (HAD superfamily)
MNAYKLDTCPLDILPQPHIRGLLIDIDDTLFKYEETEQKAVRFCADHAVHDFAPLTAERFIVTYNVARRQVIEQSLPNTMGRCRLGIFLRMFEMMEVEYPLQHVQRYETLYRQGFAQNMQPHPAPLALLKRCAMQGIKVCAVTDAMLRSQVLKLEQLQLTTLIHHIVTRMFELALQKLQLAAHEVVMVGDNHERDIAGAEAMGITAVMFKA